MQYVDSFSSRQLFDLVKSIGECRSKHEEDNIIFNESSVLKIKLTQNSLSSNKLREYMIRAVYIEMLGHDASFAYIHAIKMTNDKNAFVKRIGYLACSIFLNKKHELLVLLINTLQRDLNSRNQLDVASALSSLPYLLNSEIFSSIENSLLILLSHQTPAIRRKAYLALLCALEIKPTIFEENTDILMKGLCDSDISVKNSVLYLVDKISSYNPKLCISLIPHLIAIMKQILENNIPKEYDYYFISAPWTQINILQTLSKVASFEKNIYQIYEILYSIIKKVEYSISLPSYNGKSMICPINTRNTSNTANISYAILESCICTISSIHPKNELLDQVEEIISRFLNSDLNYLKYIGIKCLSKIAVIDPSYAIPYQIVVVDCLEDKDEVIRRCTLELLCNMSNTQNIQVVISKLINNLKISTDIHFCEELVKNILLLSEKFAPSYSWYLNTMVSLFELSGEFVGKDKVNNIAQIIAEGPTGNDTSDHEFRVHASTLFLKLLNEKVEVLPEILYNLGIWVIGEYGSCTANNYYYETNTLRIIYEATALLYNVFQKLKINIHVCQNDIGRSNKSFVNSTSFMRINTKSETISMIITALLKCYSYTIMFSKNLSLSKNNSGVENELNEKFVFFLEKMNEIYNQIFKDSFYNPLNIINQRTKEFISIIQLSNQMNSKLNNNLENEYVELLSYILPFDASCEEIYVDRKLSFLDQLVSEYRYSEKYLNKQSCKNPYFSTENINLKQELRIIEMETIKELGFTEVFLDLTTNLECEVDPSNNSKQIRNQETRKLANSFTETNNKKTQDLNETKTIVKSNHVFSVNQIITDPFNTKSYNAKKWSPEGFGKQEKLQTREKELSSKSNDNPKNIQIQSKKNVQNFLSKQREAHALFSGISNTQKRK
ncbi:adaptin family [Cryptosporidium sp. chipmunk genotype I]|uniref:adaptin family n=1 Tax=Cryptosporidium sp. chipmunk genotype I TaxID=1280935 RepID=UPI00351A5990|nr:adaptin family [Cryptosporidium sp. chipmunk genotype I]